MNLDELDLKRLKHYAQHFVSLNATIYHPDNRAETERIFSCSAFVVSVKDTWFLITAGHVLKEIQTAKEQGQQIQGWFLDNSMSDRATDNHATYFAFDRAEKFFYFDEEEGYDYAFIELDYLTRLNLEIGITALSEQAWRQSLPSKFDEYFLLGVPDESVEQDLNSASVTKTLVSAPLDKLGSEELANIASNIPLKDGLFYGQLHPVPEGAKNIPQSIVGMSGGPIFGLKHFDENSRYWVIAIQSWWNRESRIIRACYVRVLCEWLEHQILLRNAENQEL